MMLENTLRELLLRDLPEKEKTTLFEAFKQATYGKEETKVYEIIGNFINAHYSNFKKLNSKEAWGNAKIISDELSKEYKVNMDRAHEILDPIGTDSDVFRNFRNAIFEANEFDMESVPDKKIEAFFEKIERNFGEIRQAAKAKDTITIKFRPSLLIDADIVYTTAMKYLSCIINSYLHKTKGIYNALRLYDEKYNDFIKITGLYAPIDELNW